MRLPLLIALWAVLGGALALPLDALHVYSGTIHYRTPVLGLQDWWAVPLFMGAGVALGVGHRFVARRLGALWHGRAASAPTPTPLELSLALVAYVGCYASSGYSSALSPWLTLALYCAVFFVVVAVTHAEARAALLCHAAGAALVGPLVEAALSSTGAFAYTRPDLLGVAAWLPGIYLNAAAASAVIDRRLHASSSSSGAAAHGRSE